MVIETNYRRTDYTCMILESTGIDLSETLHKIKIDKYAHKKMKEKMSYYQIYIKNVSAVIANIIKQEALSKGAEAAVKRGVLTNLDIESDVLLTVNEIQLKRLIDNLKVQPFGLPLLAKELKKTFRNYRAPLKMKIAQESFNYNSCGSVMGILNVTPDSFSDGGKFFQASKAVDRAMAMSVAGADIIDIGGESTRPGSEMITSKEELKRILPVIKGIRKKTKEIIISIDTNKSSVAEAAIKNGADMINDISAGIFDPNILSVAAQYSVPIVLMHTSSKPEDMQTKTDYNDLLSDIYRYFKERINAAKKAGIKKNRIIIDPGIGFGKTYEQNLEIINNLNVFKGLGCPILIGSSRKRFIGEVLQKESESRLFGTAATVAISRQKGASIVRVHDVDEMADIIKMTDSIRKECVHA